MSKILVVGLNPAWQTILKLPQMLLGEVNRAETAWHLASGKGFNVAKNLLKLGHEVWLLQILGGQNGQRCSDACHDLGIHNLAVWVKGETRQCITLVNQSTNITTEIIEPYKVNEPHLDQALFDALTLSADFFDALVISGSIPGGVGEKIYTRIFTRFTAPIKVMDSIHGLDLELLDQISCLKINAQELMELEKKLGKWEQVQCKTRHPILAITAGPNQAYLKKEGLLVAEYIPPSLSGILNPIGAGDAVTAGMTHFLETGMDMVESFRQSLAMGSASCLSPYPAEFDANDFQRLLPKLVRHGT